jgi:hypothetical protein
MPLSGRPPGPGKRFAVVCNACIKAKKSAKKCKDLGHQDPPEEAVMETPAVGLSAHNLFGSQAAAGADVRSAVQCKELGHIPDQLEDADQPSAGRPMPSSGRPAGMRFAVVCNACIKAKKSAKKCKDLGRQEPPEEAGMKTAAAGLSAHNLFGSQAAAGSFCRAASGPSADSHLDPQAWLLERAAGGPPDGVRSGATDVRRHQPAKSVRRASGRREVAAVVAKIARTMGLCVEEEKDLSSWAKIAFWLQEQRAITDLFGRLHVPHSLFQMEGSRYSTIDSCQLLEAKAKEYKGGDLLEGFSVAELRSLWPSGEYRPASRERMLEVAFRIEMRALRPPADIIAGFLLEEHTLLIQRAVAGMSLSDLQSFVCQRWEGMFKSYKNNICAINTCVRKLEEREELAVDTEHRFRINAMCRLMRCGFSRSLFTVQQRSERSSQGPVVEGQA